MIYLSFFLQIASGSFLYEKLPTNSVSETPKSATHAYISYSKSGGRFGDNLLAYLHAKWLSYQYGIPLLYQPFAYSSELTLDEKEIHFGQAAHYVLRKIAVRQGTLFDPERSLIYDCPYFPAFEEEQKEGGWVAFPLDWQDERFRKAALEMIAPKNPLNLIYPPKDAISIAIHVREGGGFDTDHTRLYDPLKLPPIQFYLDALKKALDQLPEKKIYCRIFTDAIDTKTIAEIIEGVVPREANVVIEYRTEGNHHTKNVLEDFFSLFNFDILIRPRSNFSIIPELLHDYEIVYFPAEYRRIGTKIEICRIGVTDKKQS